jgi:hypothetical protein
VEPGFRAKARGNKETGRPHPTLAGRRDEETVVTIVAVGAAGWFILLLMCAYSKARDRRN